MTRRTVITAIVTFACAGAALAVLLAMQMRNTPPPAAPFDLHPNKESFLTVNELDADGTQDAFVLSGTASDDVHSITVWSSCDDEESTLQKFHHGDSTWSYNVGISLKNLCVGRNFFRVFTRNASGTVLRLQQVIIPSTVGYDTVAHNPLHIEFDRLRTNMVQTTVPADTSIQHIIEDEASMTAFCKKGGNVENPYFFGSAEEMGDGLWARARNGTENDPLLVFYRKPGKVLSVDSSIPAVSGWNQCLGNDAMSSRTFTISYVRPDRIFVNAGTGFETYPIAFIFDGTSWMRLDKFLVAKIPMLSEKEYLPPLILSVNKTYFSIIETNYCCDTVEKSVPGEKQEFIFSTNTLELVDIISTREPAPRY